MKLQQAFDEIVLAADEAVIFAKKPWTLSSDAVVGQLNENQTIPKDLSDNGYAYCIDAAVAREVLEVLGNRKPSATERRALLLHYSINDAYPDWVYDRGS